MTKSEFAALIGVSPGRVSQMIAEGKIGPDALEGQGPRARVRVDVARRQIADRTDVGQRFGNGLNTRLDFDGAAAAVEGTGPAVVPLAPSDPIADQIKRERLRGLELANRRAREEELERQGRYVRAEDVAAGQAKLAGALMGVFESALADLAQAVAAKFGLPARDVLHLVRAEFKTIRASAAAAARRQAEALPPLIEDEVIDASDPAQGEA